MPLQNAVNVTLSYGPETTFGVAAATNTGKRLRRVSSSLVTSKESFASNEVRPDQEVSDIRHGMRRASGGFEGELSLQTYDDLIEALLRGTWAVGISITQATAAMATATLTAATGPTTGTFTASAGSFLTAGLKVGDVFRVTGSTGNTNKNFRIVGMTATVLTVFPAPTNATAAATWAIAVTGSKLLVGTQRRSFTIEQSMDEIDLSEQFTGCRIGQGSFQMPPNGMATVAFEVLGKDGQLLTGVNAPYFVSPTDAPNTAIMAGVSGALRLAGAERAIVTGVDFQVALSLSSQPVVGAKTAPEVFYGRTVITGNVSAYLEDESLINVFLNETEVDLIVVMESGGTTPADFLSFKFPRIKFSGVSKTIGPDGGVIASFPFQALKPLAASGVDTASLVIQRSN